MAPFSYFDKEYYDRPKQAKRLFDIAVQKIARNVVDVESFNGFPSQVGQRVFYYIAENGKLSESLGSYEEPVKVWKKFLEAYDDEVLPTLDMSHSLLVINEFLEPLCTLIAHVSEVDLSYCGLGPMHDLLLYGVSHARKLKRLWLRKNGLNDISMQKITMSVRKFMSGPENLIELDLSGNPRISDKTILHLSGFKNLQVLNLSGTGITEAGVAMLEERKWTLCTEAHSVKPIETSGWAKSIVKNWKDLIEERRKRKVRPLGVYGMCRSHRLYEPTRRVQEIAVTEPPEKKFYFKRKECDLKAAQLIEELKKTELSKLSQYHKSPLSDELYNRISNQYRMRQSIVQVS